MAAGAARRFGGNKQWVEVDDHGHCLVEYALYDAMAAGADQVIWVVREQDLESIAKTVGKRVQRRMTVEYVIQPSADYYGFAANHPPLGTGHALMCALPYIHQPFVLLNADDYYGQRAIAAAVNCAAKGELGCIAYRAGQTVPDKAVHRALCHCTQGQVGLCECTLWRDDGRLMARDDTCTRSIDEDALVGMNLYALQPGIRTAATRTFADFLQQGTQDECRLTDVINQHIALTGCTMRLLVSPDHWLGITYREDLIAVRRKLAALRALGRYPIDLWDK